MVNWSYLICSLSSDIFQITIHTDTLNESACVEQSIEAFKVNLLSVIINYNNFAFSILSFITIIIKILHFECL